MANQGEAGPRTGYTQSFAKLLSVPRALSSLSKIASTKKIRLFRALLTVISVFLLAGAFLLPATGVGTAQSSYNNVQVFLQTQSSRANWFTVSAYNSSGSLVASSESQYPGFAFELPGGTYIIAATAMDVSEEYWWNYSSMEYGYLLQQISSGQSLNIATKVMSEIPQTKISVHASYANGSAASGVSVYGSTVGAWYWWSQNSVMWNQTGHAGDATLTVPSVPLEVNAWTWVPVILPKNQTTVQTMMGGETLNVTVYWQPLYVGLAGSALTIPPQNSVSITLHMQQMNYWAFAPGGMQGQAQLYGFPSPGSATVANSPTGVPTTVSSHSNFGHPNGPPYGGVFPPQYSPPIQISSFSSSSVGALQASNLMLSVAVVAALIFGGSSLLLIVRDRRARQRGIQ